MSKNIFYNITNIKDDSLIVYNFKKNYFEYKKSDNINLNIQNNKYN